MSLTATGNRLWGGADTTVAVRDNADAYLHHNGGQSLVIQTFPEPGHVIDVANNYWGTDDPDQVAEWILDAADEPHRIGTAIYLPILGGSIPTVQRSFGQVKAQY